MVIVIQRPPQGPPGLLWQEADAEVGFHECPYDLPRSQRPRDLVQGWMAGDDGARVFRLLIGQVWRLARMRPDGPGISNEGYQSHHYTIYPPLAAVMT